MVGSQGLSVAGTLQVASHKVLKLCVLRPQQVQPVHTFESPTADFLHDRSGRGQQHRHHAALGQGSNDIGVREYTRHTSGKIVWPPQDPGFGMAGEGFDVHSTLRQTVLHEEKLVGQVGAHYHHPSVAQPHHESHVVVRQQTHGSRCVWARMTVRVWTA